MGARIPGQVGRALGSGVLVPTTAGARGTVRFDQWLAEGAPLAPPS